MQIIADFVTTVLACVLLVLLYTTMIAGLILLLASPFLGIIGLVWLVKVLFF